MAQKQVKLRPHHIGRLAHFFNLADVARRMFLNDSKYSTATAERVTSFMEELFSKPETEVIVVNEGDDICRLCDNYDGQRCIAFSEESIGRADERDVFAYRIREVSYSVREIGRMRNTAVGKHI